MDYSNETLHWRLLGAAVWAGGIITCLSSAARLAAAPSMLLSPPALLSKLLSLSSWAWMGGLTLAQAPAFLAAAATLTSVEPRPLCHPRLAWIRGPAGTVAMRLAGRVHGGAAAARTATYVAGHVLSAALALTLDAGPAWRSGMHGGWVGGGVGVGVPP